MPISFKNVFYTYNPKTPFRNEALNDISLDIKDKSFTCIVGQTGCGKSTLIQQINGLLTPSSGEVCVDDNIISSDKKKSLKKFHDLRKHVGIVFQFSEYQLFDETIEEDVAFGPLNYGVSKDEALKIAHKCLETVGINESYYKKSPFELSGGEKRRVAIAGILALEPKILILDEPTAGIDPQGSRELLGLFRKLNEQGTTIILVTHDMNIVLEYATDVIVMKEGKIAIHTTPDKLFLEDEEKYSLETPLLSKFAKLIDSSGIKLDYSRIRNIDELIDEITKVRVKK